MFNNIKDWIEEQKGWCAVFVRKKEDAFVHALCIGFAVRRA